METVRFSRRVLIPGFSYYIACVIRLCELLQPDIFVPSQNRHLCVCLVYEVAGLYRLFILKLSKIETPPKCKQLYVRFTRNFSRKPEWTSLLGDWIFSGNNINVAVKVIRWEDAN